MAYQRDHMIDRLGTNRPRAGLAMKDGREMPGLMLLGLAVVAVMFCVRFAAFGNSGIAIGAGIVAVLTAAAGSVWISAARRRAIRIAQQSYIEPEPPGGQSGT